MLALWRGSGYLEVVHDREELCSTNPAALRFKHSAFKVFARRLTVKCFRLKQSHEASKEHKSHFSD